MLVYIFVGVRRNDTTVTDEKFADTCYYLGFIFTITSIIFSLFDLPNIGTKIQEIAVRFGAAMVSTVLGLGVRVYLVSFKEEVTEALIAAEDAALEATRRLSEQMGMSLESLKDFEYQVHAATKASVERVSMEVENLTKNQAEKLNEFFVQLSDRNQEACTLTLAEVRNVSRKLSDSVDAYAGGMQKNLASIETKVGAFTDAVTTRLQNTTFPDDYFAQHLQGPMASLKQSAQQLAGGVRQTSDEVSDSALVLTNALNMLRQKAGAVEASLDSIGKLTEQQQAVLDSASNHMETLAGLTNVLVKVEVALSGTVGTIRENSLAASHLVLGVTEVVAEGAASRKSLELSLGDVIGKLGTQANATMHVAKTLHANATASIAAATTFGESLREEAAAARAAAGHVASQLAESTQASRTTTARLDAAIEKSSLLATRLDAIGTIESREANLLHELTHQAELASKNGALTVEHLEVMTQQLKAVESTLHSQGADLKLVSTSINQDQVKAGHSVHKSQKDPNAEESITQPGINITTVMPADKNIELRAPRS
ncbi:hypothetical protein C7C56_006605 [Massilia glaciei]|uniref:Uncharacterized protein n=2 Tax=Massilia glaciei TaxID=1524097 RepID=A0A2U2HPJ2_9BURK|nr:hypothetical protein C7C56_006605 [Massilia glaciei]